MNRFVIADPGRCIGCNTCMAACTAVHRGQGLQAHPRLHVTRTAEATAPVVCRHCEDAPCARVCPVGAIVRADGAVLIDEKTCIGCKMCALACPFGAIAPSGTPISGVAGLRVAHPARSQALDPILAFDLGVKSVAVKCDLCRFQAQGPECTRVCPTDALALVDGDALREARETRRVATAATTAHQPFVVTGETA
ncbi:hydrogenase [Rhodoplanes elegans]|uniref:Hydrogenase n=1 Tax=Rhodoplanes elegans TaxID=29408 RepID=A0A327KTE4_9BRAD|nr:4Fe-4S dicluster domain-containing protein [Rhodoplanes elegans]MBK5960045.1 hydrogenase [Rhodoplanes elegans]RAI41621.1 hydrogenase [Rhodoplanes elegans]